MKRASLDFERLVTILANVGVIASLIFLAWEIRQNTQMIQAQTRDSVTEKQIALFEWFATDAENIDVRHRGDLGELVPDTSESSQYGWLIAGNLRLWENEWYQYRRGLFDAEEFEPRLNIWKAMVNQPGVTCYWFEFQRPGYSPDFVNLIDSLFTEESKAFHENGDCDGLADSPG